MMFWQVRLGVVTLFWGIFFFFFWTMILFLCLLNDLEERKAAGDLKLD